MASGKTANYGLSQWEATDQVVMKDFNDDNEKIDARIKEAKDAAEHAQETADNLVAVAFTPDNLPFVVGTYTGKGSDDGDTQTINLGFKPTLMLVQGIEMNAQGSNSVIATQASVYTHSKYTLFQITDTGFTVCHYQYGTNYIGAPNMNKSGVKYVYAAFR